MYLREHTKQDMFCLAVREFNEIFGQSGKAGGYLALCESLVEIAEGVFLWVTLVFKVLQNESEFVTSSVHEQKFEQIIGELSRELKRMHENILGRIKRHKN